jgi:hypothetical protein
MAQFKSNRAAVVQHVRRQAIVALDRTGQQARDEAESLTPRATGFAAESVHYVVVDEQGQVVAGQQTDGNDNPVPAYGGDGTLRLVVGSNTVHRDGRGYYAHLEQGTYGLSGTGALAAALDLMDDQVPRELGQ